MANVSFGMNQRLNPTPQNIILWTRIISIVAGVLMVWMPTASYIPHGFQDVATSLCGLIIALTNALAPLFGVQVTSKEIATSEVTAVETKTDLSSISPSAPKDETLNRN